MLQSLTRPSGRRLDPMNSDLLSQSLILNLHPPFLMSYGHLGYKVKSVSFSVFAWIRSFVLLEAIKLLTHVHWSDQVFKRKWLIPLGFANQVKLKFPMKLIYYMYQLNWISIVLANSYFFEIELNYFLFFITDWPNICISYRSQ